MKKLSIHDLIQTELEKLNELSDSELEIYIRDLEIAMDMDDVSQKALKILINSLYGALANKHFLLANPDMAAAVTSSGRFFIQLVAENVEKALQALLPSDEPYIIYGDTDSAKSFTKLSINSIIKITHNDKIFLAHKDDLFIINDQFIYSARDLKEIKFEIKSIEIYENSKHE